MLLASRCATRVRGNADSLVQLGGLDADCAEPVHDISRGAESAAEPPNVDRTGAPRPTTRPGPRLPRAVVVTTVTVVLAELVGYVGEHDAEGSAVGNPSTERIARDRGVGHEVNRRVPHVLRREEVSRGALWFVVQPRSRPELRRSPKEAVCDTGRESRHLRRSMVRT